MILSQCYPLISIYIWQEKSVQFAICLLNVYFSIIKKIEQANTELVAKNIMRYLKVKS